MIPERARSSLAWCGGHRPATAGRRSLDYERFSFIVSNSLFYRMILSKKSATFGIMPLNHDDFGLNPSKIIKLIDSKGLERDAGGKPVSTFPHHALKCPISIYPAFTGTVRCTDARKLIDEILTKCGRHEHSIYRNHPFVRCAQGGALQICAEKHCGKAGALAKILNIDIYMKLHEL